MKQLLPLAVHKRITKTEIGDAKYLLRFGLDCILAISRGFSPFLSSVLTTKINKLENYLGCSTATWSI